MITSRATPYSSEIVDIFTTLPLLAEAGIRAACKRLWLQWITAAGRQLHIEYALTHGGERLLGPERPYFGVGCVYFRWGPIYLYGRYDSIIYIAGMSADGHLDSTTCSYSVLFQFDADRTFAYVFTKYDRARQIRVELQCGWPGYTATQRCAAAIIGECMYHTVRIITPSGCHKFTVGIDDVLGCLVPLQRRTVHIYRGMSPAMALYNPGPILDLVKFMMTPRLDIWEHLPQDYR